MGAKPANSDRLIAQIAANQHGVVTAAQLRDACIRHRSISRRTKAGRLHRLHRGVYAVGDTRLSFRGLCMAAALDLGGRAVVSHRSAAAVWRMLPPHDGPIDVTLANDSGRERRAGIRIHRSHSLIADVVSRRPGIAVTKPKRTLRDLHRTSPQPVFRRALRRALDLRLVSSDDLEPDDLARSELERLFLGLCRRHRLPQPEVNARVGPYEVDFLWRERGLIAETDGFSITAIAPPSSATVPRDAHLQRLGFRVLRFTHRQLRGDRSAVVAALRPLLLQSSLAPNL